MKLLLHRSQNRHTLLTLLMAFFDPKIVDIVLKKIDMDKIDINESDEKGYTPLQLGLEKENLDIILILLKRGAIIKYSDGTANAALKLAEKKKNPEAKNIIEQYIKESRLARDKRKQED